MTGWLWCIKKIGKFIFFLTHNIFYFIASYRFCCIGICTFDLTFYVQNYIVVQFTSGKIRNYFALLKKKIFLHTENGFIKRGILFIVAKYRYIIILYIVHNMSCFMLILMDFFFISFSYELKAIDVENYFNVFLK